MSESLETFQSWFSEPICALCLNDNAGIPILLISFPLLERYVRSTSGIGRAKNLGTKFYQHLLVVFPELEDLDTAEKFWTLYRHGFLHNATFNKSPTNAAACLSNEAHPIVASAGPSFRLDPRKFAHRVLQTIESDYSTFVAANSALPNLAVVRYSNLAEAPTTLVINEFMVKPKHVR